jgi:hypothetical protein
MVSDLSVDLARLSFFVLLFTITGTKCIYRKIVKLFFWLVARQRTQAVNNTRMRVPVPDLLVPVCVDSHAAGKVRTCIRFFLHCAFEVEREISMTSHKTALMACSWVQVQSIRHAQSCDAAWLWHSPRRDSLKRPVSDCCWRRIEPAVPVNRGHLLCQRRLHPSSKNKGR